MAPMSQKVYSEGEIELQKEKAKEAEPIYESDIKNSVKRYAKYSKQYPHSR